MSKKIYEVSQKTESQTLRSKNYNLTLSVETQQARVLGVYLKQNHLIRI